LAKPTLRPCQQLSAYFTISAVSTSVRIIGPGVFAYRAASSSPLERLSSPITVFGGW
jgi:hypothetical protein